MKSLKNISYGSEEFDTIRTQNLDELKNILLKNFVDEVGDLDINDLDFSDFDGDVYITHMKVGGNLYQHRQEVEGDLFQDNQQVKGDLWQNNQNVEGDLWQYYQEVEGDLHQELQKVKGDLIGHKLEKDEFWDDNSECVIRRPCLGNADTSADDENLSDECVSAIQKKPIEVDAMSDENYYVVFMGKNRLLVSKSANSITDIVKFFDTDVLIKRN